VPDVAAAAFTLDFGAGHTVAAARVRREADLPGALIALGLVGPRPVVVVVGGAGGMSDEDTGRVLRLFTDALVPAVVAAGATVVDGGTDSGVMRLLGLARNGAAHHFPLVGVAAEHTVSLPGTSGPGTLDPHHSHVLLVPGSRWGDESPWLAGTAAALAGTAPSVTVLVNGGAIALDDASQSLADDRPVLVLDGTGRAADQVAAAARGDLSDARAVDLAGSPRLHVAAAADPAQVRSGLGALLGA
jgi:hypothetical protein